jgi:hypothetical protein
MNLQEYIQNQIDKLRTKSNTLSWGLPEEDQVFYDSLRRVLRNWNEHTSNLAMDKWLDAIDPLNDNFNEQEFTDE